MCYAGAMTTTRTFITFRKFPPRAGQHAVSDKRKPTAYEVIVDGEVIGTVGSRSRESWRQTSSGIRYSKRGYAREWEGFLVDSPSYRPDVYSDTRQRCAERLVEMAERSER